MGRFGTKMVQEETMDVGWGTDTWRADRDLVHEPNRLRVMAAVLRLETAAFKDLKLQLALEDKEIAAHTKRLEAGGLLESRCEVGGTGVVVSFLATERGRQVMMAYRTWINEILADV